MANIRFSLDEVDEPNPEESPFVSEHDELIVFPLLRFPDHYKVQAWINGTGNEENFLLELTEISLGRRAKTLRTVAAVRPATKELLFYWKLKGADTLLQEILDFDTNNKYNT